MVKTTFKNRQEAGAELAEALADYRGENNLVLALPRGGVVIGYEISKRWGWPLDLIITRKIGHPTNPEYAVGAVTDDGEILISQAELTSLDPLWLKRAITRAKNEAEYRRNLLGSGKPRKNIAGKEVLLVDDGLATGLSMEVAIKAVRKNKPAKIIAAVPVAPRDTAIRISSLVDEIVILNIDDQFQGSVGAYYQNFDQISDREIIELLASNHIS